RTSSSGLSYGIGRSRTELTTLNIVVLAPIPSASVIASTAVSPGVLPITRIAYLTSSQSELMRDQPSMVHASSTWRDSGRTTDRAVRLRDRQSRIRTLGPHSGRLGAEPALSGAGALAHGRV